MRFFSDFPFFHGHSPKNTECESSRVYAREHFHEAYSKNSHSSLDLKVPSFLLKT